MTRMHATSSPADTTRATLGARTLPLEGCHLAVDTKGGLARVRLVQRFSNPHAEALSVTYKLPLPADAAVSGFAFRIGERRIVGVVEGRSEARAQYERAIVEGRSAALLEQERSSLFTQEIGNIPPGAAIEAEIDIDQPLTWLAEGMFEWRFPLAAAPRYLGTATETSGSFATSGVSFDTALEGTGARASLAMMVRDAIPAGRSPESASHPLVTSQVGGSFQVELGSGNRALLDRDVVVRWPVVGAVATVGVDVARPEGALGDSAAFGLVTLVPPAASAQVRAVRRDLTLLIDTSGSMSGEPLTQAKRVCSALIDSLGDDDTLELIEFSYQATSFKPAPQAATAAFKKAAQAWVAQLSASGGTEMLSGVERALREVRAGSQRQIVLITDGLVGFEREIVRALLSRLPESARLHALGVGSAVNRSLLAPIARAGRGVEAIIGLGEDPERAAKRLLERTVAPAVVDVVIEGGCVRRVAPSRLGDAFHGAPLRAAIEIAPEGGTIVVRGRTEEGAFRREIQVPPVARALAGESGPAVAKLFARELVEDLEMKLSSGEHPHAIDAEIERVGKAFAIATRLTSWIAQTREVTVDPRAGNRHVDQPHELPYGMSAEGLGLRSAASPEASASLGAVAGPVVDMVYEFADDEARSAPEPTRIRASAPLSKKISANLPVPRSPAPGMAPPASRGFAGPPPAAPPVAPPPPAQAPSGGAAGRRQEAEGAEEEKLAAPAPKSPARPVTVATPAAPAKPKPLLERALDKMKEIVSSEKSAKRAKAAVADAKREAEADSADDESLAASARRILRGRVVELGDGSARIEFTVDALGLTLDFDDLEVWLVRKDGSEERLVVAIDASSYAGSYAAGVSVRVAVTLPPGAERVLVRLRIGDVEVHAV